MMSGLAAPVDMECPHSFQLDESIDLQVGDLHEPCTSSNSLGAQMAVLYQKGMACDLRITAGGKSFPVHKIVLAATNDKLKDEMLRLTSHEDWNLDDIAGCEAMQIFLNTIYGLDGQLCSEIHGPETLSEVITIARMFCLPDLEKKALHLLCRDLDSRNIVKRLEICRKFDLSQVFDDIMNQLVMNSEALKEISNSITLLENPTILQAILISSANQAHKTRMQLAHSNKERARQTSVGGG